MKTLIKEENIITDIKDFSSVFKTGFKTLKTLGFEYEKIPVQNKTFKAVEFFFKNGILDFLTEYKNQNNVIPCYENDVILGLISNSGTITLEPGCQTELSLNPFSKISDIENKLKNYNDITSKLAKSMGFSFLALGIQPVSTFNNIKIIPKARYKFMTRYLKTQGILPYSMMRETAGIQVSIDYSSEEDAMKKLSTALKLSPFLTALFSNSPVRNARLTGYKSFRANAWINTDSQRCGLISAKLFQYKPDFTFDDYVQRLLDVPMIFHKTQYVGTKTFREFFVENKSVNMSDWKTHLSLFFPDVRLKNYIEIRNHDCQKMEYALAIPAIYKGIMYSSKGIDDINELLKNLKYYDYEFARQNAARYGIDFCINNIEISDILKDILQIASNGLKEFKEGEERYLLPISNLLDDKMTPADILIKNFEGSWNKDISKLVKFSEIK